MDLASAIRAAISTLRRRPSDLIPLYLLLLGLPAVTRVVTLVGGGALWAYLRMSGRLARIRDILAEADLTLPDPEADPETFATWFEQFQPAAEILLTPTTVAIVVGTLLVTVILGMVLSAGIEAAQIAGCFGRLRQERGILTGLRGARQHWGGMLGLYLLELAFWIGVSGITLGVVLTVAAVSVPAAVLVGIVAGFIWLGVIVAVRAIFAFAPVALVVDDCGVFTALGGSLSYIRGEFVGALGYYAISVGLLLGFFSLASAAAPLGGGGVTGIIGVVLVTPALHLIKTALYGDYRGRVSPGGGYRGSVSEQLRAGSRRGIVALREFVVAHPILHGIAAVALVAGFGLGWVVAAPFTELGQASIIARLEGLIPPTAALEFFGNNWSVALATSFSGIVFAVPAVASLFFNGLVFGVFSRLEQDPDVLLAFVAPHGVFEFPGIIIAGALGIHLGITGWRNLRGALPTSAVADEWERAFWISIGLGFILAIAGLIEGFVSPFYWRLFL